MSIPWHLVYGSGRLHCEVVQLAPSSTAGMPVVAFPAGRRDELHAGVDLSPLASLPIENGAMIGMMTLLPLVIMESIK
jgi:hypothetical protein